MKPHQITNELHSSFSTFEVAIIGKPIFKKAEKTLVIPVYDIESELPELLKQGTPSVYIDKSYFVFLNCQSIKSFLKIHSPDKRSFSEDIHEETIYSETQNKTKRYELFGMGIYGENSTFDGKFVIEATEAYWLIDTRAVISESYTKKGSLSNIEPSTMSFLLGEEVEKQSISDLFTTK